MITILIILIFTISSLLPYAFLRESRHYQLFRITERLGKLYPDNDGDLLNDNIEKNITLTSISDPDSDDDFFPDGVEFDYWNEMYNVHRSIDYLSTGDLDGDGKSNILDFDSDGDYVPDGWEIENGLDPWQIDSDSDGNSDRFEFIIYYDFQTMPSRDSDNDGLPDYWEKYFNVSDPQKDYDGDGVNNIMEWLNGSDPTVKDERYGYYNTEAELKDSDNDGLTDRLELAIGTDPHNEDTDFDEIPDGEEYLFFSLPFDPDTDDDNYSDYDEVILGTSPYIKDSDMDKLTDFEELITDPTIPDSDKDLILDGDELYSNDIDRDGLPNLVELDDSDGFTTDPFNPDTDSDNIPDGTEDSDHDGRRDGNDPTDTKSDWGSGGETDPNEPDTDGGGLFDGFEIVNNLDPLDPSDDDIDIDYTYPEGPKYESPDLPKGPQVTIDPWVCVGVFIVIISIILILIIHSYFIYRKKKLIDEVIEILEAGERELYTLDTSDEIRNAIYKTYRAFLKALTKYDLEREVSMTVQEFASLVKNKLPISHAPVMRLTDVFEEARYSDHIMGPSSKNRAIQSFRKVRQDLLNYKIENSKQKDLPENNEPINRFFDRIKLSFKKKELDRDN